MTNINNTDHDLLAEVRSRLAFHLCVLYLDRVRRTRRHKTKGLLVGVESVVVLMRAALDPPPAPIWAGTSESERATWACRVAEARERTSIAAALADPDLVESMVLALIDSGFDVAERPQRWCEGRHLACNVAERPLFAFMRS
jgi:hypothetical protein